MKLLLVEDDKKIATAVTAGPQWLPDLRRAA
jgi:hypothetical protein